MNSERIIIYSDGGARGNPGPAGLGAVLLDENKNVLAEISEFIGHATNNQAEYKALLAALYKAVELQGQKIQCYLDSQLIVRQMQGIYKIKNPELREIYLEIQSIIKNFESCEFFHIKRELNKHADRLVNQAIDAAS